ncbi:hypothetical protein RD149_16170 [Gordonia westfalica]|uniref:Helix-turn-helix domain-containing protein n=1 Tax=Gordonia westfalica TaxID=158898 RepID=A0ABU2GV48_9ACTN|nr:hypothetical protein [Gordonia westfalica]MDS1115295.1 hypothetical protein [Gordonia westfalica]
MSPTHPGTPGIRVLGEAILIEGTEALLAIKYSARAATRARKLNGAAPFPELTALLASADKALNAITSRYGHEDGPDESDAALSDPELVDTATAAAILKVSPRQARRLARTLEGKQLATGCWVFDRSTVEDYARSRHHARRTP